MNKLKGVRVYLCGPMDKAKDRGEGWRNMIKPYLTSLGLVVLDPCNKPIDIGVEDFEERSHREFLKESCMYEQLSKEVRQIRCVDLRMIDICDFLIVHLDTNITMCGTWEEIFWANRMKKPILIHCEQGKQGIPDWLYGTCSYREFFDDWVQLKGYLAGINNGIEPETDRWMFFNYESLTPKNGV